MGTHLASNDTHGDVPIIPHAHTGKVHVPRTTRLSRYERELGRQWLWACLQELRAHNSPQASA